MNLAAYLLGLLCIVQSSFARVFTLPDEPLRIVRELNPYFNNPFVDEAFKNLGTNFNERTFLEALRFAHEKIIYRDPFTVALNSAQGIYTPGATLIPRTPSDVERTLSGDCKEKALWLLAKLKYRKAYLVYGKLKESSKGWHAWIYFYHPREGLVILDPTHSSRVIKIGRKLGVYIPIYSFDGKDLYQHSSERSLRAKAL